MKVDQFKSSRISAKEALVTACGVDTGDSDSDDEGGGGSTRKGSARNQSPLPAATVDSHDRISSAPIASSSAENSSRRAAIRYKPVRMRDYKQLQPREGEKERANKLTIIGGVSRWKRDNSAPCSVRA